MILPIFNVEHDLNNAMNSLIKQTIGFENIEVILVDDCSTDNTPNIIKHYSNKYKNVKPIFLKTNGGNAGRPRNIGIQNASSPYLMFMDPDDEYALNACEIFFKEIIKNNVDFVHSNWTVDTYGHLSLTSHPFIKENTFFEFENNENIKNYHKYYRTEMCAAIYNKNFILKNNIKCTNELGEDAYFALLALFKSKKVIFLADYYGYYNKLRDTKNNISVTNIRDAKKMNSRIKSIYYLLNLITNFPIENNYTLINQELNTLLNQFYTLDPKISYEEKNELLTKIFNLERNFKNHINLNIFHYFLNYFIIQKHFKIAILFSNIIGTLYSNIYVRKFFRKIINR